MTAAGDTATNPQTVGGLLAEEQTMVPPAPTSANSSSFSSALPSFLEANLVDATQASGRRALRQCLQAVTSRAEAAASAAATDGSCCWRERLASLVARAGMNYSPEIVLLSTYLAERHLLDRVSATVAEAAYGMRRARARLVPGGGIGESLGAGATDGSGSGSMALAPLTSADKVRSALFAALLPYLMERMDDPRHHERRDGGPGDGGDHQHHRDEDSSASASSALGQACGRARIRVRSVLRFLWPYLYFAGEGAALTYQFRYLAGMSAHYSPIHHLLGIVVRRVTHADLAQEQKQQEERQRRRRGWRGQELWQRKRAAVAVGAVESGLRVQASGNGTKDGGSRPGDMVVERNDQFFRLIQTTLTIATASILVASLATAFRVELRHRRRRWISGEEDEYSPSVAALRTSRPAGAFMLQEHPMPPPHPGIIPGPLERETFRSVLADRNLCPLCHRPRVNPAASTSGYVFCYRCIILHLREKGEYCPLTGVACPQSRVVRLFEETGASSGEAPATLLPR